MRIFAAVSAAFLLFALAPFFALSQPVPAVPSVPDDVFYCVVRHEEVPVYRKTFVVRLSRRISCDELRAVAAEIRQNEPRQFALLQVQAHVPGMEIGFGAWGVAEFRDFSPVPQATVFGLDPEDARKVLSVPSPDGFEVSGTWLDDLIPGRRRLLSKEGKVFMETVAAGSSPRTREAETRVVRGRKMLAWNLESWAVLPDGSLFVETFGFGRFLPPASEIE